MIPVLSFRENALSPPLRVSCAQTQEQSDSQQWAQWVRRLVAFKQEHRHCHVPPDTPLGQWLEQQRSLSKKGRLTAEHKVGKRSHTLFVCVYLQTLLSHFRSQ